jgi:hypothetical protein
MKKPNPFLALKQGDDCESVTQVTQLQLEDDSSKGDASSAAYDTGPTLPQNSAIFPGNSEFKFPNDPPKSVDVLEDNIT